MRPFRIIEHTGDLGVKVAGFTLPELFQNAALAFFNILTRPSKIEPKLEEKISVTANDAEQLLVAWLSEFLYLYETRRLLFREFEIQKLTAGTLEAAVRGEIYDPKRHPIKTEIKAVTYHGLRIEKKNSFYSTLIIFDL